MRTKSHNRLTVLLFLSALLLTFHGSTQPAAASNRTAAQWWKGNIHTHSLWSDGNQYPEMVAGWYKKHGYNFLALTDHNRLSQGQRWIDPERKRTAPNVLNEYIERFGPDWVEQKIVDGKPRIRLKPLNEFRCLFEEPDRFLLIQGEEITEKRAHLNGINLLEAIPPQKGATAGEVLEKNISAVLAQSRQTNRPMIVQINHPNYRWQLTAEEIAQTEPAKFLEIYNGIGGTNVHGDPNHCSTERMWDIVLTKRLAELNLPVVYATATDDAHHYHEFGPDRANPGRGWVVVRASRLTPESIVNAMDAGDFYASTGVSLKNIRFDGRTLEIVIDREFRVSYTTEFIGTLKGCDPTGKPVLDKNNKPIRATFRYSDQVGKVLAKIKGTTARYTLTGNEIYVRAKITSTKPKKNPSFAGELEVAWVQPVVPNVN